MTIAVLFGQTVTAAERSARLLREAGAAKSAAGPSRCGSWQYREPISRHR